ncbi:MAG: hypothetical protein HKO59_14905 [Phycisphaerales bacterium]|nr:hypothetical protein [Phycisphaerae bacterium]NNF43913.1 hypothetical protein [Phycisphaerales bacterium]NNM27248.1 hypothetical protein [Phycisphaerales bacterium]
MSLGPIRPRFKMVVPGTVDEQIALVAAAVARQNSRCVSRVLGNHVEITVVREDRHRWSPCVQLEFRTSDEGTIVDGLIGPHPNVWTLFAFVNITILSAIGLGLMLGLVQLSLGQTAWGLWTVLGGTVLLAASYLASQVGRRFAAAQTRQLIALLEEALGAEGSRNGNRGRGTKI